MQRTNGGIMEVQNINFNELKVSTTNPRFVNTVIDEIQAIFLLINQDMEKMKNLLIDINKESFLPIPFYVFKNDKETIVMDGNRRLSALKLISNPDILPENNKYEELKNLVKKIHVEIPKTIPCIVFKDNIDKMWDTLLKLHISDESKLIWSPLAQYTMSKRLGGNKYKYMETLLNYFDVESVEKMTMDNADAFTRLFTAISTRGITLNKEGKILINNVDEPEVKSRLLKLTELITSKLLNTRTNQKIYEQKVEQILLKKDSPNEEGLNLLLQVTPNSFYEGQIVDSTNLKFTVNSGRKNIEILPDKQVKFINPQGEEVDKIDTTTESIWKIKVEYLGEVLIADIAINKKISPNIGFTTSIACIQLGESQDLRKYVYSCYNSYNQNMIKSLTITANTANGYVADIVNYIFTGNNKKGTYEICYKFTDVDGTPISKILQVEVGDFIKKKITATQSREYPLQFDVAVNINIEPVVNDLINEIQTLNFTEHQSVIACSIRSVLELTVDEMTKRQYLNPTTKLVDGLKDLVKFLKQNAVDKIVKKSKYYRSYNGLNNTLDIIDINKINAVVNLGAHKSKKYINQTTFEETINKDIVQLLNITNEFIN